MQTQTVGNVIKGLLVDDDEREKHIPAQDSSYISIYKLAESITSWQSPFSHEAE
jgi:hypothetical protein